MPSSGRKYESLWLVREGPEKLVREGERAGVRAWPRSRTGTRAGRDDRDVVLAAAIERHPQQRLAAGLRPVLRRERVADFLLRDVLGQPVGAEQPAVARLDRNRRHVEIQRRS